MAESNSIVGFVRLALPMVKLPPPPPPFVRAYQHVRTADDEWRSICLRCYMVAAIAPKSGDMDSDEQEHVCKPSPPEKQDKLE